MRLVDDGGGSDHPSDEPSGSESDTPEPSESPSDDPSDTQDGEDGTPGDKSDDDSALISMPIAAQTGLSLGVIMLAAVALIPGRKPPARLRS